jgi:hypothetical protein
MVQTCKFWFKSPNSHSILKRNDAKASRRSELLLMGGKKGVVWQNNRKPGKDLPLKLMEWSYLWLTQNRIIELLIEALFSVQEKRVLWRVSRHWRMGMWVRRSWLPGHGLWLWSWENSGLRFQPLLAFIEESQEVLNNTFSVLEKKRNPWSGFLDYESVWVLNATARWKNILIKYWSVQASKGCFYQGGPIWVDKRQVHLISHLIVALS